VRVAKESDRACWEYNWSSVNGVCHLVSASASNSNDNNQVHEKFVFIRGGNKACMILLSADIFCQLTD
jgi:hypothetical protein